MLQENKTELSLIEQPCFVFIGEINAEILNPLRYAH
jgi:hypothetical protein